MLVSEPNTTVLSASEEYPFAGANPGDGWCENYALVANDPDAGINLCLYLGRQPFDVSVWHEILLLSLPDGRVLVWKSAGRGRFEDGGGGARKADVGEGVGGEGDVADDDKVADDRAENGGEGSGDEGFAHEIVAEIIDKGFNHGGPIR